MNNINIFTDGGSKGNPGPAAIGIYISDNTGREYLKLAKRIGVTTNNVAEYTAVLTALNWVKMNLKSFDKFRTENSEGEFNFFIDSSLVVNQLNGIFKIKNADLKLLAIEIKKIEKEIENKINYRYISREENKIADFLVNKAFK